MDKKNRKIVDFLVVCSGANKDVLNEALLETPRYVSIGAAILLTAALASLSGGYAIYSSFNSVFSAILFGLLWSVIIFNLDRYIVVSIDKNSSALRQTAMAIPRLIISFLLAITISKPLELRIFQGSINNKLYEHDSAELFKYDSVVSAKKKSLKKELIRADRNDVTGTDLILTDYTNNKETLLKQQELVLRNIRYAEQDTVIKRKFKKLFGLTNKLRGINQQLSSADSLINKRKKQVYSGIVENENLNASVKRRVYKELFVTDSMYVLQIREIKDKQTNRDMLVRLKALSDLKSSDDTMSMTGNLITLLFILIEMSPVLIKLMAKKGLYEAVILVRYNELYLNQKSKEEISKQSADKLISDNKRENDLGDKLWTLMANGEKSRIELELAAKKYTVKKQSQLSKVRTDKWYRDELVVKTKKN